MLKSIHLFIISIALWLWACEGAIVTPPESNQNVEDFEAAWNRVNAVYPYLEFKQIDWDSLYTVYRPQAEKARGDETYLVLRDMLYELKDGHVFYRTDGGGEVYPYYPQRHFKDRHAYSPFVVRKYFDKELKLTESRSIEYEILPDNIGYAFLSDFHEDYLVNEFGYQKGTIFSSRMRVSFASIPAFSAGVGCASTARKRKIRDSSTAVSMSPLHRQSPGQKRRLNLRMVSSRSNP